MPQPEADIAVANCRDWLEWAAVQVDVCLADDKPACDRLLESLAKMMGPAALDSSAGAASAGSAIVQKMSAVVVAVQSHDRVMQRLNHVAESLRRLQQHLGDARLAQSAESWRVLRENQMRAFSMAEERALFARIVAHGDPMGHEAALNAQDTIELFLPEPGLEQP
ncbi:MAG: hypothetical protein WBF89_09820 [Steroidobacteraceae bacterium]